MASVTNSDAEDVALALRLSKLSPDEFHEKIPPHRPEGSMSGSHPCTPTTDDKDGLALASRLSQLSSDDIDEQVAQLNPMESTPAGEKARSSAPPNEGDEDYLERDRNLSQLPASIFDGQANEHSRQRESRMTIEGASLFTAMSLVEVRTTPSF